MNKEEILKQVREYYEMELHNVELVTIRNDWSNTQELTKKYCIGNTLSRCLGVALFVQQLDIDYEDINEIYEEYKAKIENFYLTN